MVREKIREWLSAVYGLPVVDNFDDETIKIEKTISYNLTVEPIKVRITESGKIRFDFSFDIEYRVPNGAGHIGFLSIGLGNNKRKPDDFNLISSDGTEQIAHETRTEMIITKRVKAYVELDYNKVRETIKTIEFEDGLPCQKHS